MAKIQPAHLDIFVSVPHSTAVNVDLAQCLSILNRRLYRQGMMYYVESIEAISVAGMAGSVCTIPDTWVVHNAWKKGFKTWQTMQNDYADGQGSALKGKWADFKVDIDDEGLNFITPLDIGGDAYLLGEWIYSNFVYDDAGTSRSPTIHMLGSSTYDSAIGLVQEYGDARARVRETPSVDAEASTGFYAQFHGDGDIDDELGTDILDDNDLPPYDLNDYPGGHANADHAAIVASFATTAEYPRADVRGFKSPCGLLRLFQAQSSGNAAAGFIIRLAAGPYKGCMAEPMGQ